VELYLKIKEEDLKDEKGEFYQVAYDFAMVYPML
jgi:hypothetical protein